LQAHLALGNALEHKGDLEGAIMEYRTVIKRRKKSPEAHYSLGHTLQAKGDLEGAIVEYRTAISQRPNYPEAQSAVAEALKPETSRFWNDCTGRTSALYVY
jgi:tetratricopeptide (TPR) repeat protein